MGLFWISRCDICSFAFCEIIYIFRQQWSECAAGFKLNNFDPILSIIAVFSGMSDLPSRIMYVKVILLGFIFDASVLSYFCQCYLLNFH